MRIQVAPSLFLLAGMICFFIEWICLPDASFAGQGQKEKQITVTDGTGQSVTVHLPIQRIIVEYMDNAELIRILQREDKVVAVAGYDYVFQDCLRQFPKFRRLPSVGHPWGLDYETALGMRPDLLLTFASQNREKRMNLPGVDILFLGLYHPDLIQPDNSSFVRGVRNLGRLLDAREQAETYISWYKDILATILERTEKLQPEEKPTVLISSYPRCNSAGTRYCAYSQNDTLSQASRIAGGRNLVDSLPYEQGVSLPLDPEWLIRENPDFILLHAVDDIKASGYETDDISYLESGVAQFAEAPELASVTAVKNRHIYVLDGHFRNDASGGALAAAYLAALFHPDLFKDIDPEVFHQEYLKMQRLEYDLDQQGVFFFPPLKNDTGLAGIPDRYRESFF
ncbi:ABC transporter substrate-binding protein [Desulfotignum phosphitoxidans]|uniref:Putative ABC transporter, solute-binding protein n=1 Tax=Desulfotignum phosphitoxidans DSM 13687 TaxID=1286635 RepID=S0G7N8_9BACT|nr:ABC transporter substrate-binding protein [Desulfotignum phosphitoxidans]EMS81317.1 putative ABC transporter, solute-binding protein [Desulfotignum phosphitoxidans DSM 13687]